VHVDHLTTVVRHRGAALSDSPQHILGHVVSGTARRVRAVVVVTVHVLVVGRRAVRATSGIGVGIIARHAGTHAARVPILMLMMVVVMVMITTDLALGAIRAAG